MREENPQLELFTLRVLLEYDKKYKFFVAHCLETGSVATADSPDLAKEMIRELLEDEMAYAIERKNLKNLFSSPAPFDVFKKWLEAAKKKKPEIMELNPRPNEILLNEKDELPTGVHFASVN